MAKTRHGKILSEDWCKFHLSKARLAQAVMTENCNHLLAAQEKNVTGATITLNILEFALKQLLGTQQIILF